MRFLHPAAVGPGVVLAAGVAAFTAFTAFIPEHARAVGMAGSAGLFAAYSVVCLVLRIVGARLPERLGPRRSVTIAFTTIAIAFVALALFAEPWALWLAAVVIGVGMAFQYPALMALTVNRSPDHERAAALSSFTMFFEIGTVSGGLLLGVVAESISKQAAFAASVVVLVFGLWLLRTKVVPVRAGDSRLAAAPVAAPTFVPSAGD
jgi:MFS family permease